MDADDGSVDGNGQSGRAWFSAAGSTGVKFTGNAAVLGSFPTRAGVVWTDGNGTTTFEAFDGTGASLGVIGPVSIADGNHSGRTAEDRFFGLSYPVPVQRASARRVAVAVQREDPLPVSPATAAFPAERQ